jgi:hypothetical protein
VGGVRVLGDLPHLLEVTVSTEEFIELWGWLEARWSSMSSRTRAEQRAYWDELSKFSLAEVKTAVDLCIRRDAAFAPGCMTLAQVAQEVALQGLQRRALPPHQVDGLESQRLVIEQLGIRPSRAHLKLGSWVGDLFVPAGESK